MHCDYFHVTHLGTEAQSDEADCPKHSQLKGPGLLSPKSPCSRPRFSDLSVHPNRLGSLGKPRFLGPTFRVSGLVGLGQGQESKFLGSSQLLLLLLLLLVPGPP